MEPIDAAHAAFREIMTESAAQLGIDATEADVRLKIIDRILTQVLGWSLQEIKAEVRAEDGFADYVCNVTDRARLIVEAKRDGKAFGSEHRPAGTPFKLSGPVFKNDTAKAGIKQAIQYCGSKNAELACVTNGREWIVFRGNRLGDGRDTREGMAFVFPSLAEIDNKFGKFYDLLSYESAKKFSYRPLFQEAEGQPIRASVFHKALRPIGTARFLRNSDLSADIDKTMAEFFERLTGDDDPELVSLCFVETPESHHADTQLAKIAEEILGRITTLGGPGTQLTTLIKHLQETQRRDFVLIVGTKGSGKSTYITRFFNNVLPRHVSSKCVPIRVDLRNSPGDDAAIARWLDSELLKVAEDTLFPESPSFDDLRGMFFDEYKRLSKGPWKALYDSDRESFQARFGELVENMRRDEKHRYVQGLVRFIINSKRSLPIVIFDNADHFHIEFQQRVYQYARSVYEAAPCLVIVPITDRTSWQLSKHGALQSFEHEALFLPTPPTGDVIRKRIEFIERKIELERSVPDDRYFIKRGISLRLEDLAAFTRSLQRIFIQTSNASRPIGELANHDVRRTLKLVRMLVTSPHLKLDDLLAAHIAGSAIEIPLWRTNRAIMRLRYDVYPAGQHDFVQNVYAMNSDLTTTPLLGLRILNLMTDVPHREHEGSVIERDEIVAYFAGMNIEDRAVLLWLEEMLKTGLVLNYDPSVQEIEFATRLEISPAGRRHARWASGDYEYLSAMADVTPLLSEAIFLEMRTHATMSQWRKRIELFVNYLLNEDAMYCTPPDHDSYESQHRLRRQLDAIRKRVNSQSRSDSVRRGSRATDVSGQ